MQSIYDEARLNELLDDTVEAAISAHMSESQLVSMLLKHFETATYNCRSVVTATAKASSEPSAKKMFDAVAGP